MPCEYATYNFLNCCIFYKVVLVFPIRFQQNLIALTLKVAIPIFLILLRKLNYHFLFLLIELLTHLIVYTDL